MRIKQLLFASLTCAAAFATPAQAQYPERPIKIVVPQAPGRATDNGARNLAQELSKELGQSIIIENRPGGAFVIGNDAVAKAKPDGYTLLFASIGAYAIAQHIERRSALPRVGRSLVQRPRSAGRVDTPLRSLSQLGYIPGVEELIRFSDRGFDHWRPLLDFRLMMRRKCRRGLLIARHNLLTSLRNLPLDCQIAKRLGYR